MKNCYRRYSNIIWILVSLALLGMAIFFATGSLRGAELKTPIEGVRSSLARDKEIAPNCQSVAAIRIPSAGASAVKGGGA